MRSPCRLLNPDGPHLLRQLPVVWKHSAGFTACPLKVTQSNRFLYCVVYCRILNKNHQIIINIRNNSCELNCRSLGVIYLQGISLKNVYVGKKILFICLCTASFRTTVDDFHGETIAV